VAVIGQWGHSIDIVSNGAEAIEAVCRKEYDIVLMDVQMPVVDGVEATTRIRSLGGRYTTMPIIAMTASVLIDEVESFRRAGMSDHIGKPFEPSELRRIINRWTCAGASGGGEPGLAHGDDSERETMTVPLVPAMPHDSVEDDILDEAAYAELSDMIGDEKAAHIARQFADDLARRFADVTDQGAIRSDAHTVVSSAGALGFRTLSACARTLEYACDGGGDLDGHMAELLDRRRRVSEFIVKRFGSGVRAGAGGDANGCGQP
jgi:CheY-like chemotaxis protein